MRVRPRLAAFLLGLALCASVIPLEGDQPNRAPTPAAPEGDGARHAPTGRLLLPRGGQLSMLDLAIGAERLLYSDDRSAESGADVIGAVLGAAWGPDRERVAVALFRTGPGAPPDGGVLGVLGDGVVQEVPRPPGSGVVTSPAWTGDGAALIYQVSTRSGDVAIEEARTDGTERTTLESDAGEPALSADGRLLAFVPASRDSGSLLVRPLAGGAARAVVPPGLFTGIRSPRFSPDGQRLAFVGAGGPAGAGPWRRTRGLGALGLVRPAEAHGIGGDVWAVELNGGGTAMVADLPGGEHDPGALAWSPDGSTLAVFGRKGLWFVPAAGGDLTRVAPGGGARSFDWRL